MSGTILCWFGFHDWTEFGDCARNPLHVRVTAADYAVGLSHLLHGTEWTDGPWDRVAALRYEARRDAGRVLQAELAAIGEEVTLALCADVARDPALRAGILAVARKRAASQPHPPLTGLGDSP